ncbi:MAG: hypothetical protein L6V95_00660 [Candidatus Melainabacteria bacterium]|nr:MAG: hypothetical protein L6V95_00660 [Candidatus Melainabacteria bacterium]
MTPNQPDTEKFVGYYIKDDETLNKAGFELLNKTNAKYVLVTRGEEGAWLYLTNKIMFTKYLHLTKQKFLM